MKSATQFPVGKVIKGVLVCIPLVVLVIIGTYKEVQFDIACSGHITRAANANSIELATREMEVVVQHLTKKGYTTGSTAVLYHTPDADVGFWYQNLHSALEELKRVKPETTPLERTNILMKLRETLLNENGTPTVPPCMNVFPHNKVYFGWGTVAFLLFAYGILTAVIALWRHGQAELDASP